MARSAEERAAAGRPRAVAAPTLVVAAVAVVVSAVLLGSLGGSSTVLLRASFSEEEVFVSQDAFYGADDRGSSENAEWLAESGELLRTGAAARTTSPSFRMWSRRTDLAGASVELDVRFDSWVGGSEPWHGINVWLNSTLCAPSPECTAVRDAEGNGGYALDFVNRDGSLTILKKVPGDTRSRWPDSEVGYVEGGTYYVLAARSWTPEIGRSYHFAGSVSDGGDGTSILRITVDGEVLVEVVDDGSVGGPRLEGGRVGLRSDYADVTVDDLVVRR